MSDDALDNLFESYVKAEKLISNREVLRNDYIPEKLPHRDETIKELGMKMLPVLRGGIPSNVFLFGKPGTGKTCVTKYVLKKLTEKAKEQGFDFVSIFINCKQYSSEYSVYVNLCEALGLKIPPTGLSTQEVFKRFKSTLEGRESGSICLILDEIDQLVKASGSELLYNLTRINTDLKNAKVSLIGISNDTKFEEQLDARVISSLSEEKIIFKPYNATELINILGDRAKVAFSASDILDEGVIPRIAALCARDHGDARRALDLLRVASEIAERLGEGKIHESHVDQAQDQIERDTVSEVAAALPLQSKIVLAAVYVANDNEINSGDLYQKYQEICQGVNIDVLSERRISDLINELDVLGIINAQVISQGRYGRTKKIHLTVSRNIIYTVLQKSTYFHEILRQ